MIYAQFKAIIADIEKNLEGDGYTLDIFTSLGVWQNFAWAPLKNSGYLDEAPVDFTVIALYKDDEPPAYMPLESITVIQLSQG